MVTSEYQGLAAAVFRGISAQLPVYSADAGPQVARRESVPRQSTRDQAGVTQQLHTRSVRTALSMFRAFAAD
jgi:hypothetical protein